LGVFEYLACSKHIRRRKCFSRLDKEPIQAPRLVILQVELDVSVTDEGLLITSTNKIFTGTCDFLPYNPSQFAQLVSCTSISQFAILMYATNWELSSHILAGDPWFRKEVQVD
jgi:hypothetical protein